MISFSISQLPDVFTEFSAVFFALVKERSFVVGKSSLERVSSQAYIGLVGFVALV